MSPTWELERGKHWPVLVVGIETSSRVGSVALVEDGRLLAEACHEIPNAHGERLLGLLDDLFERSGRHREELSRVAVGRGPGAFTGLRIGLALAQGIATGLGIEAVGIGSLRAMTFGLDRGSAGRRYAVLDARRGELFLGGYDDAGMCLLPTRTLGRGLLLEELRRELADAPSHAESEPVWLMGAVLDALTHDEFDRARAESLGLRIMRSRQTDYPDAGIVARLACDDRYLEPPTPEYLRDADAVLPHLPPNPLG